MPFLLVGAAAVGLALAVSVPYVAPLVRGWLGRLRGIMDNSSFLRALDLTLRYEGGLADDPADRGGRTNRGVTQATYDRWRAAAGLPTQDVAQISDDEVRSIYHDGYWAPSGAEEMAWPLNAAVFDFAVNSGPGNALRQLQALVGATVDGAWGPATRALVARHAPAELAAQLIDARESFFRRIADRDATQERFLSGWLKRLDNLRRDIL